MYSRGYSQVSKSSMHAQKKIQYRSKGKSCGYYMRIVFFFSSLIQSLIIVSLVLFLVYGKAPEASTSRIQDLEESFSRLSIENVALRHQRRNLTNLLNTTLYEKARNDWDLAKLRYFSNISVILIQDIEKKLQQCSSKLFLCESAGNFGARAPAICQPSERCNCGLLTERLKARLELVESNFTQTAQRMRIEMDQIAKERDNINLEVIHLRRDKSTHEKEVDFFRQKCKDDFTQSLSGISNVSKAFLEKINSLFPSHIAFQITCPKQREHLEQIRTNCTSLSMEVEDKFQRYLNNVGGQVSSIQSENSRLKAENWRLSEDYRWCSTNRTGLMLQHKQDSDRLQRKYDEEKERLLMDKLRLNGEIEVLNNNVKYKSRAIDHLTEQIKQLNMSCMSKAGFGGFPGGSSQSQPGWGLLGGGGSSLGLPSSPGGGQLVRTGTGGLGSNFGSFGSAFNKPASTGTGSSSTSLTGSGSSFGSAFNKPASTGMGSSSTSLTGSGSSFGSAFNKPASTGTGSSSTSLTGSGSSFGSAFNKPASTGTGSSSSTLTGSGSSFGSAFNKPASSGTGSSSTSLSSTGSGSSTGSVFNKPGSTGGLLSSFGSTGSSPNLSSSGTGANKPAVSGRGSSTFGTSSGSTGIGSNKPTTSVKSSSSFGSSSGSTGSTGSTNKSGSSSSGFSWLGFGSSNSGQSKTGTGSGKGPSTGNSGTGSSFGVGRTSGLGGGSINVAQHLRDLQRIINPSDSEQKQDLSMMLG